MIAASLGLRFVWRMDKKYFQDKNVLVTGGGRGIGRAVALRLASEGANVAVNFVSRQDEAELTATDIETFGVKSVLLQGDVSVGQEAQRLATEMARSLPTESWEQCIVGTPMGRVGEAEEIANLARFLVSEESSFMTGQTLAASGGRVLLP